MKKICIDLLKIVLPTIITTFICILICSFIMMKMDIKEEHLNVFSMIIYFVSTFVMGFISGRVSKEKKYIWGMIAGFSYFVIMIMLSVLIEDTSERTGVLKALILCLAGGTFGGMLS